MSVLHALTRSASKATIAELKKNANASPIRTKKDPSATTISTLRTFLAIRPDAPSMKQLDDLCLRLRPAFSNTRVRWQDPESFQLTLQFLGILDHNELQSVSAIVSNVTSKHRPFSMTLNTCFAIPSWKKPRSLVVGVSDGLSSLKLLQKEVRIHLEKAGIAPVGATAAFHPHLRIARWNEIYVPNLKSMDAANLCTLEGNLLKTTFRVSEISMMSSLVTGDGSIDRPLHHIPLQR